MLTVTVTPPPPQKSLMQTFPAKFHFASSGVTGVKVWADANVVSVKRNAEGEKNLQATEVVSKSQDDRIDPCPESFFRAASTRTRAAL